MKIKAGLHTCPCLSSPEAEPEAKAHILLLIKEYDPREAGVRGKRAEAGKEGMLVSGATGYSVSNAPLPRGALNCSSRQPVPGGKEDVSISHWVTTLGSFLGTPADLKAESWLPTNRDAPGQELGV